jgi:hypothetical protein
MFFMVEVKSGDLKWQIVSKKIDSTSTSKAGIQKINICVCRSFV